MSHDDFAIEPIKGLPEHLPRGEVILWQGRPHWWHLTVASMNLWWVIGYFGLLTLWRFVTVMDVVPFDRAVAVSLPFVVIGAVVALLFIIVGIIQSRATVYTITNKRVAMRVGAALTVTLNIPFTQIENAALAKRAKGFGNIALETKGGTKFSFLVLWPHARPWHFARPQPTLRAIPNAEAVAHILAKAAKARVIETQNNRQSETPQLGVMTQ
ncbi:photosynthetic complex putative assembly protein PuhB [Rhodobacteraceae bacterium]|jgi:hypothetical protein|nr:photosynthetic complex putative assembly protein PuhB [Paracoccaceae bacterium]